MERRIAVEQGLLLAAAAVAAVLLSDFSQWEHPALLTLLLAVSLMSDRLSVTVGAVRFTMVDLGIGLTALVAGPAPGVAMAIVVMAIDAISERLPTHAALANVASYAAAALAAGEVVESLLEDGTIVTGEASYAIAAAIAMAAFKLINALVLAHARNLAGFSPRAEFRESFLPVLPWDAVSIGLAAAAAHAYVTLGIGSIVALVVVLMFFRKLLENIATAERAQHEIRTIASDRDRYMQQAIVAEERERRRLAAELHDDALQMLQGARADLVDGLEGDEESLVSAHDAVAASIRKLRDLMVRLGPEAASGAIGPAITGLAERVGRRSGFEAEVDIAPGLSELDDPVALGVVRELLVNAAKHARATRVSVRVVRVADDLHIEVADDGIGFGELDRVESLAAGHVGLALVEQRVASRRGTLTITPGVTSGTVITAVLQAGVERTSVRDNVQTS